MKKLAVSEILLTLVLMSTVTVLFGVSSVKAQRFVRVYVDQPLGYLPFQAPGTKFSFYVNIETSGIPDYTADGIIQWKMDMRINPNVLDINTTMVSPPPFPSAAKCEFYTGPRHFLYEFAVMMGYSAPSLTLGENDPENGYQDEISETSTPPYTVGAGDYWSSTFPKMLSVDITSESDTVPCLIDLIDVMYRTGDLVWHYAEYVEDGYYGAAPPTYLSSTAPFDPTSPIDSTWHELYPHYSNNLVMTSHTDNGDGELSASDQVDFLNETDGWTYWYHVDAVTVTIHWTFKTPVTGLGDGEPYEANTIDIVDNGIPNPIGSTWHQLYPEYSREFVITSHEDTDGDGALDPSEQFDFRYQDEPGTEYWAHLDSISTDLILSFKEKEPPVSEFPLSIGLIMAIAPMIPVIYLWRKRSNARAFLPTKSGEGLASFRLGPHFFQCL